MTAHRSDCHPDRHTDHHRRTLRRNLGLGAAGLTAVLLVHLGSPGGVAGFIADVAEYDDNLSVLEESSDSNAALDEQYRTIGQRMTVRAELLDALSAGRASLPEVCERFRPFVHADEAFAHSLELTVSGSDTDERLANSFLMLLFNRADLPPQSRPRLTDEFRRLFGREPDLMYPMKVASFEAVAGRW